jgi:hypothetical protein
MAKEKTMEEKIREFSLSEFYKFLNTTGIQVPADMEEFLETASASELANIAFLIVVTVAKPDEARTFIANIDGGVNAIRNT